MPSSEIKLAYHAQQRRIRAEFAAVLCFDHPTPPEDLLKRATAKLEQELNSKNIVSFQIYGERLKKTWDAVRQVPRNEVEHLTLQITLGMGYPALPGLQVEASSDPKNAFLLTISGTPSDVRQWHWEWVELAVEQMCAKAGIHTAGNIAQVHTAFFKARNGAPVRQFAVQPRPPVDDSKPYKVLYNRQRREAMLVIYDSRLLREVNALQNLTAIANDACGKIKPEDGSYTMAKQDVSLYLKRAIQGPEAVGVDMPLPILIAVGVENRVVNGGKRPLKPAAPENLKAPRDPGYGLLHVNISSDSMTATIVDWDPLRPEISGFKPTPDWIKAELMRQRVKFGIDEKTAHDVARAMNEKTDVNGVIIAQGKEPQPASEGYIHHSYRDKRLLDPDAIINIRESQRLDLVHTGQIVAEIRWKKPSTPGYNILGDELPAPTPEAVEVVVGEGVEVRNDYKFFATHDGTPVIEGNAISVSPSYVHKGDINLKSGNINFNGTVVIEGSIDHGASVVAAGDILVKGQIGAAFVKAKGTIQVNQGIVTTEKGRVQAGSHINASFIDNSNILTGGDLIVSKALLNSRVIAGGCIDLGQTGVIGGGELSCKDYIKTGKLGYPKGALTVCHVGVDWRKEQKIRLLAKRLARLEVVENEKRLALRELTRKKQTQLSSKYKEMLTELQNFLVRVKAIMGKITSNLNNARTGMDWDKNAKIYVYQNLVANVDLEVGGVKIPVKGEMLEVVVSAKKHKGEYITSLTEDDLPDGDKKAG